VHPYLAGPRPRAYAHRGWHTGDLAGCENTLAAFARAVAEGFGYLELDVHASADGVAGSDLFDQVGCATCHMRTFTTAPAGSVLNAGTLVVSQAVGNKLIHPFSDFLLHDIGTGDGIVQNGGQGTANLLRTPPLWGLHVRGRMMHDLTSVSLDDAINRHRGEASRVTSRYRGLSSDDQRRLKVFLSSL
jgi:CxxC motif-containing protein (DUF1111 family)